MTIGFVHCSLITLFEVDLLCIVPHTTSHVACLLLVFASNNVQYESIAGHLLIIFDFDDISDLDTSPVPPFETLMSSLDNKLFNRLSVYDVACLSQSFVFPEVQNS